MIFGNELLIITFVINFVFIGLSRILYGNLVTGYEFWG